MITPLVVVMLLDRFTAPEVEKGPRAVMAPVAPMVNTPELRIPIAPACPVAANELFTAKFTPCNIADPTATVFEKVVVPAAVVVRLSALIMLMVLEKRRVAE